MNEPRYAFTENSEGGVSCELGFALVSLPLPYGTIIQKALDSIHLS